MPGYRIKHHAHDYLPVVHQCDAHRVGGVAVHVVGGAIQRIDDPGEGALLKRDRTFLGEKPCFGKQLLQRCYQHLFGFLIDVGDIIACAFELNIVSPEQGLLIFQIRTSGSGDFFYLTTQYFQIHICFFSNITFDRDYFSGYIESHQRESFFSHLANQA